MSPTVFKVIPSDKSGLQLTKKGFTAKKKQVEWAKKPAAGEFIVTFVLQFPIFCNSFKLHSSKSFLGWKYYVFRD